MEPPDPLSAAAALHDNAGPARRLLAAQASARVFGVGAGVFLLGFFA